MQHHQLVRSSALLAALVSLTACAGFDGEDGAGAAVAESSRASAVTTAELANFPDGENCLAPLEARAAELFENWFATHWRVQSAWMVNYSGHGVVAWNSGGSYRLVLRAVLQGEAGGLILQVQTLGLYDHVESNELAFFDATGKHTATIEGVYYFHLDDHTLLVSTAMGDPGEYDQWYMVREQLAAVSLTGQIRWKSSVGGHVHGEEWATYPPSTSTWSMHHPRLAVNGRGEESGLFWTPDGKLVWAYYAYFSGSPQGGIRRLDPATGASIGNASAVKRDRLCTAASTDPDCAAWAWNASVRAEWWVYWEPRWSSWKMTGFVPPVDDHWLMVEVATVEYDVGGKRRDGRKLLFYPAEIEYPYRPYAVVEGMYYRHADDNSIIASRTMGSSGWVGRTQTPWYGTHERLIGLSTEGQLLWDRPLRGEPAHSGEAGTSLTYSSTLTELEGGALLWWSFTSANGGSTDLEVIDPLTGGLVPPPSPYARRATCTPAGTPLWRTRTITENMPIARSAPAVSTLSFTGADTIKGPVFVRALVDSPRNAYASDVTLAVEHDGVVVVPPYPAYRDDLDANRVIELPVVVSSALRGQPIAGDWTLRVANGDNMKLAWWSLGVNRELPGPSTYRYTATATVSAQVNTVNQTIALAAGQTLVVGTCGVYGAAFNGDTYLRLIDPAGVQVAVNDDACGRGSRITYTAPTSQTLEVRAGCFVNYSCDGTVAWMVY